MIDIKLIRENTEQVKSALEKRGAKIDLGQLMQWDSKRREIQAETENLRQKRNTVTDEIAKLKQQKQDAGKLMQEIESVREKVKELENNLAPLESSINDFLLRIPNMPDDSVPLGKDEKDNKIVRTSGAKPVLAFKPRPHWELGKTLDILDFETASKLSGSRFSVIKGLGCRLERSLITFMIDTHIAKGYREVLAPYLVSRETITGTGQLPKFEEEVYKCTEDNLYLIPTAEVPITNLHRDEVLEEKDLPRKYVSYSACFRKESGSYGKDTKGLIRNHQFNKIELVKLAKPEESMQELETLTNDAENILSLLGLHYRVVELCSADIGFSSSKTYDLEVWMPGENMWREISSCSNCKDFQARRMNTKFKRTDGKKEFVHTLNGSGVAVGRVFAAILENYQNPDGSITVPEALRGYMKLDCIK